MFHYLDWARWLAPAKFWAGVVSLPSPSSEPEFPVTLTSPAKGLQRCSRLHSVLPMFGGRQHLHAVLGSGDPVQLLSMSIVAQIVAVVDQQPLALSGRSSRPRVNPICPDRVGQGRMCWLHQGALRTTKHTWNVGGASKPFSSERSVLTLEPYIRLVVRLDMYSDGKFARLSLYGMM